MINLCRDQKLAIGIASDIVDEVCKRIDRCFKRYQESERLKLNYFLQHGNDNKHLKNYLRKAGKKLWGRPRFKTKGISIQYSVRKTDQTLVKVAGNTTRIRIPLIGKVKGRNDRQELLGQIKQITVHQDSCKQWWARIVCDGTKPKTVIISRSKAIGVDLGLKHTVTAANNSEVIQPERERFLDKQIKNIQEASRNHKRDLPFIYRKITRRRKHSHHVMAKRLLEAADIVYVGDLNSKWLFSGKLARSASDAAHYQFKQILTCKAENADKTVKVIHEAYTSQTCNSCGKIHKMELKDRVFECPFCSYSNDRDVNAALNILKIGESLHLDNSEQSESHKPTEVIQ
jgi:putative transposase